jgi:hypothetical protein
MKLEVMENTAHSPDLVPSDHNLLEEPKKLREGENVDVMGT